MGATFAVGIDAALTAAVYNLTHTAAHELETLHSLHLIEAGDDERRESDQGRWSNEPISSTVGMSRGDDR